MGRRGPLLNVDMIVDVVGAVAIVSVAPGTVTELHLRIGLIGFAAYGALVQIVGFRLGFCIVEIDDLGSAAGLTIGSSILRLIHFVFGPALPVRDLAANIRGEEEQVIEDGNDGDQSEEKVAQEQVSQDRYGEERCVDPGQPLGFDRNDKEEQELQVGVKGGKGKEHGHIYIVHGSCANQETDQNVENDPEEIENGKFAGTPFSFQGVANEVIQVEGKGETDEVLSAEGDKNKCDDSPNLPVQDCVRIEGEQAGGDGVTTGAEHIQQVDEYGSDDDVPHQSGQTQPGMFVAEAVQPLLHGAQRNDLLNK